MGTNCIFCGNQNQAAGSICTGCSKAIPLAPRAKRQHVVEERPGVCSSCGANDQLVDDVCSRCGRWVTMRVNSQVGAQAEKVSKPAQINEHNGAKPDATRKRGWIAAASIMLAFTLLLSLNAVNPSIFNPGNGGGSWANFGAQGEVAPGTSIEGSSGDWDKTDDGAGSAENYWVASNARPQDTISGALAFYCESAPYQPSMWLPYGSSGIFYAVSKKTGIGFYVQLSPGTEIHTTVLSANESNAKDKFDEWGCSEPMIIRVGS